MVNVLVADDDVNLCIHMSNAINTKEVRCVGIENKGTNLYERIKELNPDVLILDMNLPEKNGLEILKEIQSDSKLNTKVFVYSGEPDYVSKARNYECVERYYSKLTPVEEIGRVLNELANEITQKNTGEKITKILFNMGFSYYLNGTKLICDCILYSIDQKEEKINKLYEHVAKVNGKNAKTVKSDINTAVNNMWRYGDKKKARRILRVSESNKPSTKDVISMVKYYVEN